MALCAGIGGLEIGLDIALPEYRCVCYVERETYPAAVLVSRMANQVLDEAPIWDDIETFDGRPWRGVVDIISAGVPCQPWSDAGKRQGVQDERWIWEDIARIIGEVRPVHVFLENVPGLVRGGLGEILGTLAILGYDAEWDLFSAAAVGAPHIRKRLFVLAYPSREGTLGGPRLTGHDADEDHYGRCSVGGGGEYDGRTVVAHANGIGREGCEVSERSGRQEQAEPPIPCHGGPSVANPNGKGLLPSRAVRGGTPFPIPKSPGNGWEWWSPEPELGRVVDGIAHRVDRVRAIGNAVVPGVAAVAFKVLESRFG